MNLILPHRRSAFRSGSGVPKTDLVSLWKMTEASGTRYDAHGANDLIDNNGVGQGTGNVYPNCADIERGNLAYLNITDAAQSGLDITGDITIGGWVNQESRYQYPPLASKWSNNGNQRGYFLYHDAYQNEWEWAVSSDGTAGGTSSAVVSGGSLTSTWYFVAAYYDSSANEIGVSIDGGTPVTAAHAGGIFDSSAAFELGSIFITSRLYYFDGLMGPVFVFSRRVPDEDIVALADKNNGFYTS